MNSFAVKLGTKYDTASSQMKLFHPMHINQSWPIPSLLQEPKQNSQTRNQKT